LLTPIKAQKPIVGLKNLDEVKDRVQHLKYKGEVTPIDWR